MTSIQKEKPEIIRLNLMRSPRDRSKVLNAKLKGGVVEYPGMDPNEPIVYFGQPQYTLFDLPSRKIELFYNMTTKSLLKLNDLGGAPKTDAIMDLTRNFTIAAINIQKNLGAEDNMNELGKWTMGIILIVAVMALVFIYLMATHGATAAAQTATTAGSGLLGKSLVSINTT